MTAAQPDTSSIAPDGSSHAVHFYENDDELSARVAAFIGEALLAGDPAVIIASPPHRQQFIARLAAMNVDVEAERLAGNLTILDAAATLGKFMVGAFPESRAVHTGRGQPHRIHRHARQSVGEGARLRRDGRPSCGRARITPRAIALEEMWTISAPSIRSICSAPTRWRRSPRGRPARASADLRRALARHGRRAGDGSTDASRAIGARLDQRSQPSRDLAAEIARRKQVEMALRSSVQELKRVQAAERERAARAKQLADDLRETIRVNELFVGVLAHDLRAPLTAIMTAAGLLRKRQAAAPDARNAKVLGRLMSSGERMSRMVEQLLDFTRLRVGGGFTIEPRDADLASLARQVVDELDEQLSGLRRRYPPDGRHTPAAGTPIDCARCSRTWWRTRSNTAFPPPASGLHRRRRAPTSSACRCTTWARSRPPAHPDLRSSDGRPAPARSSARPRAGSVHHPADRRGARRRRRRSPPARRGTTFTLSLPRVATRGVRGRARARAGRRRRTRTSTCAAPAQDQLRESQTRFRLLVEAVKDYAIFMLDPSGRVVTWNAGAERIKGYEAARSSASISRASTTTRRSARGKCERELEVAAREGRFEDEGWRVRKDGTKFWANVVITALRDRERRAGRLRQGDARSDRAPPPGSRTAQPGQGRGGDPPARRVPVARLARAEDAADRRCSFSSTRCTIAWTTPVTASPRSCSGPRRAASAWRCWWNRCSTSRASRPAASRWISRSSIWSTASTGSSTGCARPPIGRAARCRSSRPRRSWAPGIGFASNRSLTNLLANAIKYARGHAGRRVGRTRGKRRRAGGPRSRPRDPGGRARPHLRALRARRVDPQLRRPGPRPLSHPGDRRRARRFGDRQERDDGGALFQITLPLRATVEAADGDLQPVDVN